MKVKSLSHVRLFATSWTLAYQAPLSMGFSRQGYWSGLPFPSPGALPDPGNEPGSPALQANALPSEPQGKPKNTGVGSRSLLQWIFPTQKSNWGLLHCRQILYQLSHQGICPPYPHTKNSGLLSPSWPGASPITACVALDCDHLCDHLPLSVFHSTVSTTESRQRCLYCS